MKKMNDGTMKKVYLLAQEHCGLKVGDWVRVTRKAEDFEAGWDNVWTMFINKNIGKVGVIKHIHKQGVEVFIPHNANPGSDRGYYYPYFILEKVKKLKRKFKPFDKVLVREGKTDLWKPDIFFFWSNYFCCTRGNWSYCIPYEGNEHLVGTTNEPEE